LISYDLSAPETIHDYNKISQAIKTHVKWAKALQSVWLVRTNRGINEILNILKNVTDANDKLLVIEVTSNWMSYGISREVADWMKRNI